MKFAWWLKLLGLMHGFGIVGDEAGGTETVDDVDQVDNVDTETEEETGTETEEETETEAETETETEEETETDENDPVQQRIDRLTREKKEAREKLATAEAELAELRPKVAVKADPAQLLKSGLAAGLATKDEVEIVAKDVELANGINFLRNKDKAIAAIKAQHPDWEDADVNAWRMERMNELTGERAEVAGLAATIKYRVKQESEKIFEAGLKALRIGKKPVAAAGATVPGKTGLVTKLRKAPGAVPAGSGGGGMPTAGSKLMNERQLTQLEKAIGEDAAAEQWVLQNRARRRKG